MRPLRQASRRGCPVVNSALLALLSLAAFAPPAPAQAVKLNSAPAFVGASSGVWDFAFTPDGSHIVYRGNLTTDSYTDLYSASSTVAGTQVQIDEARAGNDFVDLFVITPDGSAVIYPRYDSVANHFDLLRSPATSAGAATVLVASIVANGVEQPHLTPDGATVVYEMESSLNYAVFSASATALSTPLQISSPFPNDSYIRHLDVVNVGGQDRAIYDGELETSGVNEIFSAPVHAAGGQIKLNSTPVASGQVSYSSTVHEEYKLAEDGATVVYHGDLLTNNVDQIYKASTTAPGTQTVLSSSTNPSGDADGLLVDPAGTKAYFIGNLEQPGTYSIYGVSLSGAPNQTRVFDITAEFLSIDNIVFTPDSQHVFFDGDLTTPGVDELYTAPATFLFEPRRLTTLSASEDVQSLKFSPDGSVVAYLVRDAATSEYSLWAARTSGEFAPVRIGPDDATLTVVDYQFRPDGGAVAYTAYKPGVYVSDLYAVAIPALDTTPNPNPPGAAVTPPAQGGGGSAVAANSAPTILLTGKKKIKTTAGKPAKLKGTATDDGAVASVLVTYKKVLANGKKKNVTKPAKLSGGAWSFKLRPAQKTTKLLIQAVDDKGLRSAVLKVTVVQG